VEVGSVPGRRYGMVIDLRRCTGCSTCSVACKSENEVPLGVYRTWVKVVEKGRFPNVKRSFLPIICNHCEKPICVTVCPVKAAFQRKDGIVAFDPHRCIGCRYCMAACPYEVRYVHPWKNIVEKCTFCLHRVDEGLEPACVSACPTDALIFGDLNDPESEVSRMITYHPVQVLKPEIGTEPRVYYIAADIETVTARRENHWSW
jgi:tetrathionate reductase subunit B